MCTGRRPGTRVTSRSTVTSTELERRPSSCFAIFPFATIPRTEAEWKGWGYLVVRHDNLDKNPDLPPNAPSSQMTTLVTDDPAPPSGDPLNYSTTLSADRMKIGGRSINAPPPLAPTEKPPLRKKRGLRRLCSCYVLPLVEQRVAGQGLESGDRPTRRRDRTCTSLCECGRHQALSSPSRWRGLPTPIEG